MSATSCFRPARRLRQLAVLAAGSLFAVSASALSPNLLVAHSLQYDVYRGDTELGDGKIELKPAGTPDCWYYSQEAFPKSWLRWLSGDILEQSHVCVLEGRMRPIAYRFNRSGVGASKENFSLRFDWSKREVTWQNGNVQPLTDEVVDRLSLQLVLRDWLLSEQAASGKEPEGEKEVIFADRKKLDSYVFQVKAHEEVKVPAGTFRTTRLDRIDNKNRRSQFWLSPEHGYIVIKAEQQKDDDPVLKLLLKKMPAATPAPAETPVEKK